MNIEEEKVGRYFAVTVSYIHYILVKYGGWSKNSGYFIDEFRTIKNFKFWMNKIPEHFPDIFWTFKKFRTFFLDIFLGKFQMIKNSGHFSRQIPDNQTFRKLVFVLNPAISGQFPDISGCTRTFLDTISGHFFFIGMVIFLYGHKRVKSAYEKKIYFCKLKSFFLWTT